MNIIIDDEIIFETLGQTGLKIKYKEFLFLVDPYLSNSVEELDAKDLKRKIPIPYSLDEFKYLNWVFLTHDHIDHCDPHTIPKLAKKSNSVFFMGPYPVRKKLIEWGINRERIFSAVSTETYITEELTIRAIPAAHPSIVKAKDSQPSCVGWLIRYKEKNIYVAGDTSICKEIIEILKKLYSIELAFLPVNEDNYFRRERGIIGNMTVREAFYLSELTNIKNLVPVHWDMFLANSVLPEEMEAIYKGYNWSFNLILKQEVFYL